MQQIDELTGLFELLSVKPFTGFSTSRVTLWWLKPRPGKNIQYSPFSQPDLIFHHGGNFEPEPGKYDSFSTSYSNNAFPYNDPLEIMKESVFT